MPSPDNTTRICTKCKAEYPATLEYFHYQKHGKYNLSSWCIYCHRERNKINAAKLRENPEYREAQRLYDEKRYQEKRDYYIEHNHRYYADNHEKELERTRLKYIKNADKYKLKQRIRSKTEKGRQQSKKDAILFRQRHPDKVKARAKLGKAKRRAMIANAEGSYTAEDVRQMYIEQDGMCAYCGIRLFWDMKGDVHLEHIIPLSRGGSNWPDNLCLSCKDCNEEKSTKTPSEWQAVRGW